MSLFKLPPIQAGLANALSSEVARLQAALSAEKSRVADLEGRLRMREAIIEISHNLPADNWTQPTATSSGKMVGAKSSDAHEWNAPRDVQYADADPNFDGVAHVFHKEWFGMRAAAGSLPGQKLAISAKTLLSAADVMRVAERLRDAKVHALVFHGFSDVMANLARSLRALGFNNINLVWHGAAGMWLIDVERKLFFAARELLNDGTFRRMHGMRPGTTALIGDRGWRPQLLNLPPTISMQKPERDDSKKIAFAPSWNLLHKNLWTNLMGALITPRISEVLLMAKDISLPKEFSKRIRALSEMPQSQMLATMNMCDVALNVSLVDCHPMVEMEALAVGTPCLRGRLCLDVLEDHAYVALTEVDDPLNVEQVSKTIERVLDVPHSELSEIMSDYARKLRSVAKDRYLDFVS